MKPFIQRSVVCCWLFGCVGLVLGLGASASCQESLLPTAPPGLLEPRPYTAPLRVLASDQLVDFAEQLMQEGEYFRAITEFRRFLFFYPEDHRAPMIHFRIGLALYRGQSYAEAAKVFSTVANRYGDSLYGQHAWLWLGESLLRQGLYSEAERLYTRLAQHFAGSSIGQQALYTQGWLLLYRRHWHEASVHFGHIAPSSPFYVQAQSLVHDALQGTRLPEKSPFVAGLLSALLPGSGQLYNGRRGDALLAFFLNGLFIAGILEAMQHHKYTVAGILSFFEIAWYSGNVYGAVNGAYKTNQHTTRNFLQNLENRYQPALPEMRQSRLLGIKFSLGF